MDRKEMLTAIQRLCQSALDQPEKESSWALAHEVLGIINGAYGQDLSDQPTEVY